MPALYLCVCVCMCLYDYPVTCLLLTVLGIFVLGLFMLRLVKLADFLPNSDMSCGVFCVKAGDKRCLLMF